MELLNIECDVRFIPKPRTIHQLATFFALPEKTLYELSNLTETVSPEIQHAAIAFAANAKKVTQLDPEEKNALNAFVKFLSIQ
ncbi:MAG: hypothetical protein C0483_03360 [Pirellula sp.]|nr:hypothetical protein [Pirellula sp.]